MEKTINLYPYVVLSADFKIDNHTLIETANVILIYNDEYYYLEDDSEKIIDVSLMPHYIKDDWINYNKKELNLSIIDRHINQSYKDLKQYVPNSLNINKIRIEEELSDLKSIRRDYLLKIVID